MSATKRLRELLDERGILYDTAYDVTMWTGSDGHGCTASEIFSRQNGKPTTKHLMIRRVMTPEQAIAATLGDADLAAENAKLRELLLDYDKMLAIAANEIAYMSRGLRMDSVLNALRIRMYELGIEVDG